MRGRPLILVVISSVVLLLTAAGSPPARATDRTAPTRPMLSTMSGGNTVGAPVREDRPRADGYRHLDTPAMIAKLRAMHATTYTYGVWDSPKDWDDLRLEFAPAARAAGIEIMVYLAPPSECFPNPQANLRGRCSEPFEEDYPAWGRAIATLAKTYHNVTSWAIDDFLAGAQNGALFTKAYLAKVRGAADAVYPVKFYVTLYAGQIDDTNLTLIQDSLDGVIYPYLGYNNNGNDATYLEKQLDALAPKVRAHKMSMVLLVYAGRFLDGITPPDERAVAETLRRATPYLSDGRIAGVIAYGAPTLTGQQAESYQNRAHSGAGRLSLSIGNFQPTPNGSWAGASQQVAVAPGAARKTLSFSRYDDSAPPDSTGYQYEQVLVDGTVAWSQDIAADAPRDAWLPTTVDLTAALANKTSATLTLRLFDAKGVGWWPTDVGIDDVTGTGIAVTNGTFESDGGWQLDRSDPSLQPLIDIYHQDRPARVFNAVGAAYARYQGQPFVPLPGANLPTLRTGPANRAMYGNGRLSLSVPGGTAIPAGKCAAATQTVTAQPNSPRYEVSFWHTDRDQNQHAGELFKEVDIDGKQVWSRDANDWWPWYYINGNDQQGPVDVTDFVRGKHQVTLSLKLCTTKPVTDFGLDVSVDNVHTVGLNVANPGFEHPGGWQLTADTPLRAALDLQGPPVDGGQVSG